MRGERALITMAGASIHPTPPLPGSPAASVQPEFGIQSRHRHDKHYFSFPWRPRPAIEPGLHAWNAKTAWPTFPPSYKNKISLFGSCQSSGYLYGHFEEEGMIITFENSDDATKAVRRQTRIASPKRLSDQTHPVSSSQPSGGRGSYPLRHVLNGWRHYSQNPKSGNCFLQCPLMLPLTLFWPPWTLLFLEHTKSTTCPSVFPFCLGTLLSFEFWFLFNLQSSKATSLEQLVLKDHWV